MSISSRIHDTIEDWQAEWKDRLRGWALRTIAEGVKKFLEDDEVFAIDNVADMVAKVNANPATPQFIRDMLARVQAGSSWWQIIIVIIMAVAMAIQTGSTIWQPGIKQMSYEEERVAQTARLDPLSVITAWRRDAAAYAGLFDDLKDLGWSDDRIEALKFVTLVWPSRQDLLRYVAKEALEPEAISKYGLMDEFDRLDLSLFDQIGVSRETARLDWIAHWEHASWIQVVEMLHRGLITEQDVRDWFRLVEIPPFWRQLLIDSAYTWPTRVDVRRWWDMRTIDETELRRLYSGMGYRGGNLDNYVLWTKVYVAFPDLLARYSNGWITLDDVRAELTALGMPPARVETMIQTKIKPDGPARTTTEKNLTKTEIYKGVKKELITWDQGIELLMDLGYDEDEADYILAINVEALEGSPETYEQFKDITTKYKRAVGMTEAPVPEELKAAADELVKIKLEVEALERSVVEERRLLTAEEDVPDSASKKLKGLQVALNRARSELQRIQLDYNSKVAAWRHGVS